MAWEANQIIEVRIVQRSNEELLMNVLHYVPGTPGTGVLLNDLVAGFATAFGDTAVGTVLGGMRGLQSNQTELLEFVVQPVFPTRYASTHFEIAAVGTLGGACDRQNTHLAFTKKGRLGNRANIGTFHLGGVANVAFLAGELNPAHNAAAGNMAAGLLHIYNDVANGIEYFPVILNKEPIPDTDPVRYRIKGKTNIVDVEVQPTARVMYRRTKGVGK